MNRMTELNFTKVLSSVLLSGLLLFFASTHVYSKQICNPAIADPQVSRFSIKANKEVHDSSTGLIWQLCLVGQSGKDCQAGEAQVFNWLEALQSSDEQQWRLPNIRELASIVELKCSDPAVNLELFPNQLTGGLWSSSPYQFYDHYAWYLDTFDGVYIYGDRQDKKYVRLVKNQDQSP